MQGPHFSRTRIRPDLPPQTRPLDRHGSQASCSHVLQTPPNDAFSSPQLNLRKLVLFRSYGLLKPPLDMQGRRHRRSASGCLLWSRCIRGQRKWGGGGEDDGQSWTLHVERRTMESETARMFQTLVRHKDTSPHAPIWLVCKYTCYASTGRDALQGMRRSCNGRACSNVLEPAGEKDDGDSKDSGDHLRCIPTAAHSTEHRTFHPVP